MESALWRPQTAAHYEEADLVRQAAILAIAISQAQAFVDGNKRTALAACVEFVERKGSQFVADPVDFAPRFGAVAEVTDLAERTAAEDDFEAWLRRWMKPKGPA